jgi:hypothetical protein
MDHPQHVRLLNAGGELIAEGLCWLDEAAGLAMLEPEREPGVLQKERGELTLELESGRSLLVSDRPIIFKLRPSARGAGPYSRRTRYRLRLITSAQEATAVGVTGEGSPAAAQRQTPAAR